MSRFNLINEAWIPVRFLDGQRGELGIAATLLRSKEIAAIEDPSPLVVAALHRFLLAVLYRALEGPTDIERSKSLFNEGLPFEKITAYLEKWRDRFWLFDDSHPFGQIPGFVSKVERAWTVLAAEHNADNAKVLFDHVNVATPGAIDEGRAARGILATQTFSVSCGKSELSHTGTAPSATAVMALPLGRDLQDTLLFSLVHQNRAISADDSALWERPPESLESLRAGVQRNASGNADLYTWRTRSILIKPRDTGGVETLAFASGVGFASEDHRDPMVGYRINETRGKLPMQFRDRGLWREFDSLLPDAAGLAPQVIPHAVKLSGSSKERFPHSVLVLGQANNKAKIEFWRMERFALPGGLAGAGDVRSEIHKLLVEAEAAQKSLYSACRTFAGNLLSRGDRDPAPKDIAAFLAQMQVIPRYWSTLEHQFQVILPRYTVDRDPDALLLCWKEQVLDALRSSWDEHRGSVSTGDAWAIRALAKASALLGRKIKELENEIHTQPEPQKEGQ